MTTAAEIQMMLLQGTGAPELAIRSYSQDVSTMAKPCTDLLALADCQQLDLDLPPALTHDWMKLFDRTLFSVTPSLLPHVSYRPEILIYWHTDCRK